MIVSSSLDAESEQFEKLLDNTSKSLGKDADSRPNYYMSNSGTKLEKIVYEMMSEQAKGSVFEKTIELKAGSAFPDIIAKRYWGLEIKSSIQNHWTTTGNSVLESSRVFDVRRIYLLFGKLCQPIGFRYKKYEECLYKVAVTHSPRYLVDMDTLEGQTIFELMGISYDELRNQEKPIKRILDYYRKLLKPGEDLWWLDSGESEQVYQDIKVKLWGNLTKQEKDYLRNKAMALFPIIFGNGGTKYSRLATWLAGTHGVVAPSLRDSFTAGGQTNLKIGNREYKNVPQIYKRLQENLSEVIDIVRELDIKDTEYYWGILAQENNKLDTWMNLVKYYSDGILKDCKLDVEALIRAKMR